MIEAPRDDATRRCGYARVQAPVLVATPTDRQRAATRTRNVRKTPVLPSPAVTSTQVPPEADASPRADDSPGIEQLAHAVRGLPAVPAWPQLDGDRSAGTRTIPALRPSAGHSGFATARASNPFSRLPSTLRRNDQRRVASYEAGAAPQHSRHQTVSCGAPCARVPPLPTQPNNRTYPESAGDSIVGLVDPVSVEDEVAPRRLNILGQKPGSMQEVGWIRLRVDCAMRGAGTGPSASDPLAGMPQPGPCGS